MNDQERMGAITEEGISSAISKLMEHPEIIGAVASALGSSSPLSPTATATATASESADSSDSDAAEQAPEAFAGGAELASSLIPMISRLGSLGIGGKDGGKGGSKHSALLCALKPYLSPNRRDAIDYMLKISQLSDIISKLR